MPNRIKLLIVEDDPSQIFLIREALEKGNFDISDIPDGNEALEYLLSTSDFPNLILMDYHLPGLDGLSILNELKAQNRKFNIIFLTADYSIETAIQSISAGALDFIPKDGRFVNNIGTIVNKACQRINAEAEKEQYEQAYKESEARFKMVMDASKDGIFEWNRNTGKAHASPNNAYMLGFQADEFPLTHETFFHLLHPDDREMLMQRLMEHAHNNTAFYEAEIRIKTKDGSYKWILERGIAAEKDEQNNPVRVIGTHSDISERKAAEEIILKTNTRLTNLIGNLPGIVYRCKIGDHEGREFIGGRVKEITGFEPYELINEKTSQCFSLIHPADLPAISEIIRQAVHAKSDFEHYYRIITKSGEIRWVWDHGKILFDENGWAENIEGYIADVTEKKESELALMQSEEEKNIILDNSMHAFILLTPEGKVVTFNKVANHRAILTSGHRLKKQASVFESYPEDQQVRMKEMFARVIQGEPSYWEQPFNLRGNISWYENVMVPVLASRNEIKYVCFTSTDITERKMAEEKILTSESLYNTTINSINDLLIVVDAQNKIILTNDAAMRFNKANKLETQIYGKKVSEIYYFINSSLLESYENVFTSGKENAREDVFSIEGKTYHAELKITPVFQAGKVVRAVTLVRDITERKNFEKRIMNAIIETEERERKRFSEDLHDEMGSILSTIKIYINTLHNENIPVDKRGELVEFTNQLINQAIQNSKEIANNLSPNVIKRFGIISALHSFCEKIRQSSGFAINFDASGYSHELKEDEEISIYRIITELVNNSIKHSQGKQIDISCSSSEKALKILFSDNGTGFDFSNALLKNSTGLGLQNILSRINSLNGIYKLNDNAEKGFNIEFELVLPEKQSDNYN